MCILFLHLFHKCPTILHCEEYHSSTEVNLKRPSPNFVQSRIKKKYAWLENVSKIENVANAVSIARLVHHANLTDANENRCKPIDMCILALLPMNRNQAHSVATIKHAMEKIQDTSLRHICTYSISCNLSMRLHSKFTVSGLTMDTVE